MYKRQDADSAPDLADAQVPNSPDGDQAVADADEGELFSLPWGESQRISSSFVTGVAVGAMCTAYVFFRLASYRLSVYRWSAFGWSVYRVSVTLTRAAARAASA